MVDMPTQLWLDNGMATTNLTNRNTPASADAAADRVRDLFAAYSPEQNPADLVNMLTDLLHLADTLGVREGKVNTRLGGISAAYLAEMHYGKEIAG